MKPSLQTELTHGKRKRREMHCRTVLLLEIKMLAYTQSNMAYPTSDSCYWKMVFKNNRTLKRWLIDWQFFYCKNCVLSNYIIIHPANFIISHSRIILLHLKCVLKANKKPISPFYFRVQYKHCCSHCSFVSQRQQINLTVDPDSRNDTLPQRGR